MSTKKVRRPVRFGVVELFHFGIPSVLDRLVDLNSFQSYLGTVAKIPEDDDLSLGYAFLVALVLERLIDSFLLDPSLFGLRWNELVNRSHQTDTPFSEFPGRSELGNSVRTLAVMYRVLLPVRSFGELRKAMDPVKTQLMPELLEWSEEHEFVRSNGADANCRVAGIMALLVSRIDGTLCRVASSLVEVSLVVVD